MTTTTLNFDREGRPGRPDVLLTPKELAGRWQVAAQSLANDRCAGRGPAYVKIGSRVRYRLSDVLAWEDGAVVLPGREWDAR